jgi:hypothetical protein
LSLQINANETPGTGIVAGVIMTSDCDFGDRKAGEALFAGPQDRSERTLHDLRVARFASTLPTQGEYRLASLASKLRETLKR